MIKRTKPPAVDEEATRASASPVYPARFLRDDRALRQPHVTTRKPSRGAWLSSPPRPTVVATCPEIPEEPAPGKSAYISKPRKIRGVSRRSSLLSAIFFVLCLFARSFPRKIARLASGNFCSEILTRFDGQPSENVAGNGGSESNLRVAEESNKIPWQPFRISIASETLSRLTRSPNFVITNAKTKLDR